MIGDKEKASRVVQEIGEQVFLNNLEEIVLSLSMGSGSELFSRGIYYEAKTRDGVNIQGWVECEPIFGGWGRARRVARIVALHYASQGIKVQTQALESPIVQYH